MSSFFIFKFGILLKKARGDTPPSTKKKAKITKRCLRIFEKLKRQIVFLRLSFNCFCGMQIARRRKTFLFGSDAPFLADVGSYGKPPLK